MKKILVFVLLSLLICENSFAGCKQDVKFSWWKNANINFQFHNKGSKHVRITKIYVSDSDGDKINDFKPTDWKSFRAGTNPSKGYFLKPYEKKKLTMGLRNAIEFGKTVGWRCTYQKPYKKSLGDKIDEASDSIGDTISSWFKDDD